MARIDDSGNRVRHNQPENTNRARPAAAGRAQPSARSDTGAALRTKLQADGFESTPRAGTPVSLGSTGQVQGAAPVAAATTYPEALQTQRDLSNARIALGEAQLKSEQCLPGAPTAQELTALQDEVTRLEGIEAAQTPEVVEQARYQVFTERMPQLEATYGTAKAVELARQTYYNGGAWAEVSGAPAISDSQINALGLPHGARHPDGNGGFLGEMRTPDGQRIDIGHVMCAVDFSVNASRQPATLTRGPITIDNPFNPSTVGLAGDLATAIIGRTQNPITFDPAANHKLIAHEGNSDWRGDIDGLNLANRMANDPSLSFSQALGDYYGGQPPASHSRIDELATHSQYFKRDENGQPIWGSNGYEIDTGKLAEDGRYIAFLLNPGTLGLGALQARQVTGALEDWMRAERSCLNGNDD